MPSRFELLTNPDALPPKSPPLYTSDEVVVWQERIRQARVKRDERDFTYYREQAVRDMWLLDRCQRVRNRPVPYLWGLISIIGSRYQWGATELEDCYTYGMEQGWEVYNTPENRWWVDKILEGLAHMPRSYAMSAAMRYFMGRGKQKGMDKPGAGLLSVENGWRGTEVEMILKLLYNHEFGKPLLNVTHVDPYGEDGREMREEYVDPWGKATVEYDQTFIGTLRGMLAEMGMTEPALKTNIKGPPKPRKVRDFKPGLVLKPSDAPDLPVGTIIRAPLGQGRTYGFPEEGMLYKWGGKTRNNYYVERTIKRGYSPYDGITIAQLKGLVIVSLPESGG